MTDMTVAKTILLQLGGAEFIALTGSKNFMSSSNMLLFKVGKNPKRITHVRITLTPEDAYTMEFLKVRNLEVKVVEKIEDVYCDMLQDLFEKYTGLFVTLVPRKG